ANQVEELSRHLTDPVLRAYARGMVGNWKIYLQGWCTADSQAIGESVEVLRRANWRAPLGVMLTNDSYNRCHRTGYREACGAATEGLRLTLESGDAYHYMCCLFFQAWALMHLGEWGDALRLTRDGLQMAEKNGHRMGAKSYQFLLAWLYEEAFDFRQAGELCEPADLGPVHQP